MNPELIKFFNVQRRIFGICPRSGELFRLSECKIYLKTKPVKDWMDNIDSEADRLGAAEERLDHKEKALRTKARDVGRRRAVKIIRKIDRIFTPRKLNPDDAKVVLHPIDYIVFNGMNHPAAMKNVVLLDRQSDSSEHRQLQRSIERTIEKGNYEWVTLRIGQDGSIEEG